MTSLVTILRRHRALPMPRATIDVKTHTSGRGRRSPRILAATCLAALFSTLGVTPATAVGGPPGPVVQREEFLGSASTTEGPVSYNWTVPDRVAWAHFDV